ncbi:MAG: serine/threonine protein kinase [Gemmataceae bacterium]
MATPDLGACEWFVWDLRRSNLIDRGQLDQVIGEFLKKQPRAEPPELAQYLVNESILSQFQAERLLQGKTQGLVLGPYTLVDALGSGSMGTVYKAHNKNDDKWYAVKVLPRRSMWNVRIARRQVRAFEQCRHPSVVPFVDVGTSGGTHYLAWPLVDGTSLDLIVQQQGRLAPEQAAQYVMQTAEGLDVCHSKELIHGLIKPSNLLVTKENQIRILDFGIGALLAESEGESLVDTMSTANTLTSGLDCGSPESILDPTNRTAAGDQYSLGCVLYYLLTGQYPFPEGTAVEKMMAHQMKQPTSIGELAPDVPEELIAVVEKLMQKSPEDRYPRAGDAAEALKPLIQGGAKVAVPRDNGRVAPAVPAAPAAPAAAKPAPARPAPAAPPARPQAPAVAAQAPAPPAAAPATRPSPPPRPAAAAPQAPKAPAAQAPAQARPAPRPQAAPARPPAPARPAPPPQPLEDLEEVEEAAPAPARPAPPPRPPLPPRPSTNLPSREAVLRRPAARPPAPPAELPDLEHVETDQATAEPPAEKVSLEEQLGTAGLILVAILVAVVSAVIFMMIMPK